MRKCKFITPVKRENGWENDTVFGMFHQWGLESEEYEDGGLSWTVAIIETCDGQIHTPSASRVQFLPSDFIRPEFDNML